MTFLGGATVSSNQRRHVVWLTEASQWFQVPRVVNFPTSLSFYNCVTMDENPASVHSACSMLRMPALAAAMKVTVCCYDSRSDAENFWDLMVWQNVMLKWMWCGSAGSCDDFFVRYWKVADCCLHLQKSNWNCATALSILVIIVNFSVSTTCVYINSTYKWSISMDMMVEIWVTKLLT